MSRNHKQTITLPPSRVLHYMHRILTMLQNAVTHFDKRVQEDQTLGYYSVKHAQHFLDTFQFFYPANTLRHPDCDPIFAEPGYTTPMSGCVAIANWNAITEWWNGTRYTLSDLPERVGNTLERIGVDLLWSDEWEECSQCGRLIRTNADSYGWKRSAVYFDGEVNCIDCVSEYAESFLGSLECGTRSPERGPNEAGCLLFPERIDPSKFGYVKQNAEEYENGFHPGQDDNPKRIANALLERGLTRFFFALDDAEQFCVKFSVWVHEEDIAEEEEKKAHSAECFSVFEVESPEEE